MRIFVLISERIPYLLDSLEVSFEINSNAPLKQIFQEFLGGTFHYNSVHCTPIDNGFCTWLDTVRISPCPKNLVNCLKIDWVITACAQNKPPCQNGSRPHSPFFWNWSRKFFRDFSRIFFWVSSRSSFWTSHSSSRNSFNSFFFPKISSGIPSRITQRVLSSSIFPEKLFMTAAAGIEPTSSRSSF